MRLAVLAAFGYGLMDITVRFVFRGADVAPYLAIRSVGAAALLVGIGLVLRVEPRLAVHRSLRPLVLGGSCYAAEALLLNLAFQRMSVGPVVLIFFAYPSVVTVISFVRRKEPLTRLKLVPPLMTAVGVGLVLGFPTAGMNAPGALLAAGACLTFSLYVLLVEPTGRAIHPLNFSALVLIGSAVSIGLVGLFEGSLGVPSGAAWSWIALHVVLITVAVAALAAAITRIGAAQASIGLALEPAIAVVGAALILRESPGPSQVVGSVLLVGAVALLPFADSNPGSEHASQEWGWKPRIVP